VPEILRVHQRPCGSRFQTWRQSPSDAGPCRNTRSSTRSRPAVGSSENARLRAGNRRPCAKDRQTRDCLSACRRTKCPGNEMIISHRRLSAGLYSTLQLRRSKEPATPIWSSAVHQGPDSGGRSSGGGKDRPQASLAKKPSAGRRTLAKVSASARKQAEVTEMVRHRHAKQLSETPPISAIAATSGPMHRDTNRKQSARSQQAG
jgi:hypothetical protein